MRLHLDEKLGLPQAMFWFRAVNYGTTGTGSNLCSHSMYNQLIWFNL